MELVLSLLKDLSKSRMGGYCTQKPQSGPAVASTGSTGARSPLCFFFPRQSANHPEQSPIINDHYSLRSEDDASHML
jgi:hypothetical protein